MGGCCGCKQWLKLLAGLILVLVSAKTLNFDPWLVVGLYLMLRGLLPMMCKCDQCKVKDSKK